MVYDLRSNFGWIVEPQRVHTKFRPTPPYLLLHHHLFLSHFCVLSSTLHPAFPLLLPASAATEAVLCPTRTYQVRFTNDLCLNLSRSACLRMGTRVCLDTLVPVTHPGHWCRCCSLMHLNLEVHGYRGARNNTASYVHTGTLAVFQSENIFPGLFVFRDCWVCHNASIYSSTVFRRNSMHQTSDTLTGHQTSDTLTGCSESDEVKFTNLSLQGGANTKQVSHGSAGQNMYSL